MKHFYITTTFSIQVDFTVEARDEVSAEKKIKNFWIVKTGLIYWRPRNRQSKAHCKNRM